MARRDAALVGAGAACAACAYWVYARLASRRRRRRAAPVEGWRGSAQARLIGGTPLLELASLSRLCGATILAKCEQCNPSGTGKDRIARAILEAAEERGVLPRGGGGVVVEGSSGSTTIALATLALAAGHRLVAVLPDDCAAEKRDAIAAFPGVEVRVVRAASISSPSHYVNVARSIAKDLLGAGEAVLFADQFDNPANVAAHVRGTAAELLRDAPDADAFVMGAGTGGTIAGVSRVLTGARIYLADPEGSALHGRVRDGVCYEPRQAERTVRRHRYDTIADGVGLDRVTANFAAGRIDDALRITDAEAVLMARYLLRFEGLFLGSSSALNCVAAIRVAAELRGRSGERPVVVTVLCDAGHRYLSRFWSRAFLETRGLDEPPADAAALEAAVAALLARPADEPPTPFPGGAGGA